MVSRPASLDLWEGRGRAASRAKTQTMVAGTVPARLRELGPPPLPWRLAVTLFDTGGARPGDASPELRAGSLEWAQVKAAGVRWATPPGAKEGPAH